MIQLDHDRERILKATKNLKVAYQVSTDVKINFNKIHISTENL